MLGCFELRLTSKQTKCSEKMLVYSTHHSISVPREGGEAILSLVRLKIFQKNAAWRLLELASTNTTAAAVLSTKKEKRITQRRSLT